jgi:hypothetical protein
VRPVAFLTVRTSRQPSGMACGSQLCQ